MAMVKGGMIVITGMVAGGMIIVQMRGRKCGCGREETTVLYRALLGLGDRDRNPSLCVLPDL